MIVQSYGSVQNCLSCEFESGADTVDCLSIPAIDFAPDACDNHPVYDVPNFHRLAVHRSTVPLASSWSPSSVALTSWRLGLAGPGIQP